MNHQLLDKLAIEIGRSKINEAIVELERDAAVAHLQETTKALEELKTAHIQVVEEREALSAQLKEELSARGVRVAPARKRRKRNTEGTDNGADPATK